MWFYNIYNGGNTASPHTYNMITKQRKDLVHDILLDPINTEWLQSAIIKPIYRVQSSNEACCSLANS